MVTKIAYFTLQYRLFYSTKVKKSLLHISQPAQDVVKIGNDHEQDEDAETNVLGVEKELLRRLAPRNHLVDEEENVASVECGDRQDVHEGEDD